MGLTYGPTSKIEDDDERTLRNILGKRLRQVRKQSKLTMVVLGQMAQCSQGTLSKIENGNIIPSIILLYRLARALKVNPSSLLSEATQSLGDQTVGLIIVSDKDA